MNYNYDNKLEKEIVVVSVCDESSRKLLSKIETCGELYGFRVVNKNNFEASNDEALIKHLIWVCNTSFSKEKVNYAFEMLESYSSISIAFEYLSSADIYLNETFVNLFKIKSENRINFLMPDIEVNGKLIASDQKIIDNAVCDTIRIKYIPKRRSSSVIWERLDTKVKNFFVRASTSYEENKLWFRSKSDGYFACRVADGFAITATKTTKYPLEFGRVSIVHKYDYQSNTVVFSGKYLPSSDCVEAAILFDVNPDIESIVHTHASKLFTRNPFFTDRIKVGKYSYGERELGDALSKAIMIVDDGFLIMEEHGEVFSGRDCDESINRIEHFVKVSEDA